MVGGPTVIYIPRTMTSVLKKKNERKKKGSSEEGRDRTKEGAPKSALKCFAFVLATPKTGGSFLLEETLRGERFSRTKATTAYTAAANAISVLLSPRCRVHASLKRPSIP